MKKHLYCLSVIMGVSMTINLNIVQARNLTEENVDTEVEDIISDYFSNYKSPHVHLGKCQLDSIRLDHDERTLDIYANVTFGYQPFNLENTTDIYQALKQIIPKPINKYDISIHADGKKLEQLIPNYLLNKNKRDKTRLWQHPDKDVAPWVTRTSRPYDIKQGLDGRHIAVGQSHGRYYKNQKGDWTWQRPKLFCTTEDLFTQSFVVPYLIPMLEKAGAVVVTPRERDPQIHEVIVDNDGPRGQGNIYYEEKKRKSPWTQSATSGFAFRESTYDETENPFIQGTARQAPTARKKKNTHTMATWIPYIPESGAYAVYVSYQTLEDAIPDAHYTVVHKGGATEFIVNQQMGGGTWVYLGTFEFDQGQNEYGFVTLSNMSDHKGVVSADAVRFGGGMGNISRENRVSGFPRYLEGARYTAQWAGMPYTIYAGRKGENDYADDINTRSHMANYLAGGSWTNPSQEGMKVPIEMTVGVHSDAGFSKEDSLVGTLGIYTTDFNQGLLAEGMSRYTSRDLTHLVMEGLKSDLSAYIGKEWPIRGMWNRNYSESRLPEIPSMILETLSHQNFADMKLGHDPGFKFTLARSVYKSIVRFLNTLHGTPYTIAPLPVENFSIKLKDDMKENKKRKKKQTTKAILSWTPVSDPIEPSAKATGYVVYTRIGYGGFDNGQYTKDNNFLMEIEPGVVYSFKVSAVNEGGESLASETLTAFKSPEADARTILIVNGFDRLSAPSTFNTDEQQGFDMNHDAGVPYLYSSSFCGVQQGFDKKNIGIETEGGLGFSGEELEAMKIAGNTFDYPFIHGKAIQAASKGYSFVSCSDEAIENGFIRLTDYPMVDLIYGMEKQGGKSAMNGEFYQTFSNPMKQAVSQYLTNGGKLLISGAYLTSDTEPAFMAQWMKCQANGTLSPISVVGDKSIIYTSHITGSGLQMSIPRTLNEERLAVQHPERVIPLESAFAALAYDEGGYAAIAYHGDNFQTFTLGFPFECIREEKERAKLMKAVLRFFFKE